MTRSLVVDVQNVEVSYGERVALHPTSFHLAGGTTALVGVNGAGKSTLIRTLAGAQRPTSGSVFVDGRALYRRRTRQEALGHIAVMPQLTSFPGSMTVNDVVAHIGWLRGLPARSAAADARRCIDMVGLGDRATTQIKALSGGMLRRVALAQAIVSDPAVVLLDEPSTGLDPEQRRIMIGLVKDLDSTVLFSSHVVEDVVDVADRVLVLEGGRLIDDLSLHELVERGRDVTRVGASDDEKAEAGFLRTITTARRHDR